MKYFYLFKVALLLVFFASCNIETKRWDKQSGELENAKINFSIIGRINHDTNSFTEGLFINDGQLFESTGAPAELPQTQSLFGVPDTITGVIKPIAKLDKQKYFGEGIAYCKGRIFQLTYTTNTCFVYDSRSYSLIGHFRFLNKEG